MAHLATDLNFLRKFTYLNREKNTIRAIHHGQLHKSLNRAQLLHGF